MRTLRKHVITGKDQKPNRICGLPTFYADDKHILVGVYVMSIIPDINGKRSTEANHIVARQNYAYLYGNATISIRNKCFTVGKISQFTRQYLNKK